MKILILGALLVLSAQPLAAADAQADSLDELLKVFQLISPDPQENDDALVYLQQNWRADFVPMLMDVARLVPSRLIMHRLFALMQEKTGAAVAVDADLDRWYEWMWNQDPLFHPNYAEFKSLVYGLIDPNFRFYFSTQYSAKIRLDEVVWGGVPQDGIPPLRQPAMIAAADADYLEDDHIVFGLQVNGDTRAYPQRILGHHEMFVDKVGGVPVGGVYCTLCGTMVLYKTTHHGIEHELGTSGFLYRSNKLMYDKATHSLWNTMWGAPVIGPLADLGIALERLGVVTSTWGEWRRRHPDSQVLSLDTGYPFDYAEGAAYRAYFATDELMFTVPKLDKRLNNKDEVLALRLSDYPDQPLALSAQFLRQNPLYHDQIGDQPFVVLTDDSGANRVYATAGLKFASWDLDRRAVDVDGTAWTLSESELAAADGRTLPRLPAHRAFWFGWYSAFNQTRLVK